MPFKTRKHKMTAAQRRFVFTDGKVSLVGEENKEGITTSVKSFPSSSDLDTGGLFLKKELLKIVITSLAIISSQIALRLTLF